MPEVFHMVLIKNSDYFLKVFPVRYGLSFTLNLDAAKITAILLYPN